MFSRRRETLHAYRALLNSPHAKLVLADLARFAGVNATNFRGDPHETAFREGRRDLFHYMARRGRLTVDEIESIVQREEGAIE